MIQRGRGVLLNDYATENTRGVFKSVADLEDAIKRYIRAHNKTSKPFQWSASAVSIFKKLSEIPEPSECVSALEQNPIRLHRSLRR